MALLTTEIQDKLLDLLIGEGLVARDVIEKAKAEASKTNQPIFSILTKQGVIDDELLTHATAQVSGVPYVNLRNTLMMKRSSLCCQVILPKDSWQCHLAEVQNRLAVAMIDANNVQAVDYLSNLIQRPIKVFMASEAGVRHILDEYKTDLSSVDVAAEQSEADETNRQKLAISKLWYKTRRLAEL